MPLGSECVALRQRNQYTLRRRPKGVAAPFGLAVLVLTLLPARIGEYEPAWLDDECLAGRVA